MKLQLPSILSGETIQKQLLRTETYLEHAPIPLFLLDPKQHQKTIALNGSARRLIAPGRASSSSDLFAQLEQQSSAHRHLILFETEQGIERALLASTQIQTGEKIQRLIALMPVENELQIEAQQAWQNSYTS